MITMMIEQQKDPVVREEYEEYAYLYPYVKKAFEVIVDLMQARMTPSVMRNPFMIVPAVPDISSIVYDLVFFDERDSAAEEHGYQDMNEEEQEYWDQLYSDDFGYWWYENLSFMENTGFLENVLEDHGLCYQDIGAYGSYSIVRNHPQISLFEEKGTFRNVVQEWKTFELAELPYLV